MFRIDFDSRASTQPAQKRNWLREERRTVVSENEYGRQWSVTCVVTVLHFFANVVKYIYRISHLCNKVKLTNVLLS